MWNPQQAVITVLRAPLTSPMNSIKGRRQRIIELPIIVERVRLVPFFKLDSGSNTTYTGIWQIHRSPWP